MISLFIISIDDALPVFNDMMVQQTFSIENVFWVSWSVINVVSSINKFILLLVINGRVVNCL